MTKKKREENDFPVDGILSGLTGLVDKLNELAQTGKELRETGEFGGSSDKGWRGVYGFKVRTGLGDEGPKVEPFGNVQRNRAQDGYTVTPEVLEPVVDVFEEPDHTLIVAEMPGIGRADIRQWSEDDILQLDATGNGKTYHKEILLPRSYQAEDLELTCNNGIVEIKCRNN